MFKLAQHRLRPPAASTGAQHILFAQHFVYLVHYFSQGFRRDANVKIHNLLFPHPRCVYNIGGAKVTSNIRIFLTSPMIYLK